MGGEGRRGREQTARTFGTGAEGWRRAKREAVWAQTRDGEGAVLSRRIARVTQDAPPNSPSRPRSHLQFFSRWLRLQFALVVRIKKYASDFIGFDLIFMLFLFYTALLSLFIR